MLSRSKLTMLAVCAGALLPVAARAEPLPPELNLVPRDAALFVSVRVSDLWNEARLKPLRDFLVDEGRVLREMELNTGFKIDDVERVSLVCPSFNARSVVGEPLIVVTFKKPYDLAKMLEVMDGMTEAEMRNMLKEGRGGAKSGGGVAVPKGFPPQPPRFIKPELPPPPKPDVKDPQPLEKEQQHYSECGQKVEPDDPPAKGKNRPRDLKAAYYFLGRNEGFLIPINERTIVIGFQSGMREMSGLHDLLAAMLKRSDTGPLTPALEAAAGKHALVLGVNLPAANAAIPEKGWVNVMPIDSLRKCRSVTATFDFGDEIRLALNIDAPDEATARRVLDVARSIHILGMESFPGLKKLGEDEEGSSMHILLTLIEPIFREAKFELKGTTASVVMASKADEQLAKTIKNAIEKLKEGGERAEAQNNLKQLAIAVHNYQSAYGQFPFRGVPAPNGNNAKLSWRVTILPYIEQQQLYNQFKLDEPWDSDHNKKLIAKMPKLYAPLGGAKAPEGHTFYRTFTGPNTFGAANGFAQITDGTSNTIMFVEAGESTPWTKPEDFPYDPNKPLPKLGGHFKGRMYVALGDGSVRMIDLKKMSETTLRAAITANGGEVLGSDW